MDLGPYIKDLLREDVGVSEAKAMVQQFPEAAREKILHDGLSQLARAMIETNRHVQEERRGFLSWLNSEIGIDVSQLSGRKSLETYEDFGFEALLALLNRNEGRLRVDPHRRTFRERIRQEYETSVAKVLALRHQTERIDRLIDELVYRLYELSQPESELVRNAIIDD